MLFRMWALFRAAITCPGARTTKLVISCDMAPIRPGVTEDLAVVDDVPDGAPELTELPTSLLLLALDILKHKDKTFKRIQCVFGCLRHNTQEHIKDFQFDLALKGKLYLFSIVDPTLLSLFLQVMSIP